MKKIQIAVLVSGGGTNLQALIDLTQAEDLNAEIALVLSNKPQAYGLERAREAGIPTAVVPHTDYDSREDFDMAMHKVLLDHNIEFVCLAGFMRLLTPGFVEKWAGKMVNIHPSLLPKYKGLNTHQRVLDAGEKETGCTIHFVTAEMDVGPIIVQETVPVLSDDTVDTLAARVLIAEHHCYQQVFRQVADGRLAALQ